MTTTAIAFVGLPGSGKTCQASIVAARNGVEISSAGLWLRGLASAGDPEALQLLANGAPMDQAFFGRWARGVVSVADDLVVIDGTPRTTAQVDWLDAHLRPWNGTMVLLDLPRHLAQTRLRNRGGQGDERRADDHEELILRRTSEGAVQELERIAEAFAAVGKVIRIAGDPPPDRVARAIQMAAGY